jgi:peptidyl-prolyl cis-trans isomerase A (cyclophilin A)
VRTRTICRVLAQVAILAMAVPVFGQTAHRASTRRAGPSRVAGHSLYRPSSLDLKAPAVYRAKFITTKGDFIIEIHRAWAPLGADRFYNLVRFGFYNGASFFRMLPGFVVQFGLSPNPRIARAWSHAAIKDDPVAQGNSLGTVTFAMAGPNTRTTQVFINLADNARLDQMGFAPIGKVTEGMSVVRSFYSGYGEGAPRGNGPDQDLIEKEGKSYLVKNFPKLDRIKVAEILRGTPPHHASAHRAASTKKPAH